ncbi:MAG TPA: IS4 family transposase [Ktedonobacteraceae bacterium]|nr:IS4 family transposase [Ktedonobacteraceae bacterium]
MSSIPQVSQAMQTILSTRATALERSTGFVQRSSVQLDGAKFAQTCVLTWMQKPDARYSRLRHTAASLGVHVRNQALEQRFGPASSRLMRALLEEAVQEVISSEARVPELLGRFNGVYLQDGTVLSLPAPLAEQWPGSGGKGEQAALRIQARVELGSGRLSGLWLQAARAAERSGPAISTPLPRGSLFDADMGYFTLTDMRERDKAGQYWTAHAKANLSLRDKGGQWWTLLAFLEAQAGTEVDVQVFVGKQERLAVRLIAVRVSKEEAARRRERANKQITHPPKGCQAPRPGKRKPKEQRRGKPKRKKVSPARLRLADWTIVVTNVPQELLSGQEVLVLVRCRGPIELLWKLWKSHGKLDTWRSYKPERILTEIYAKLLGLVITHWQTLLGCWQAPNRSLVKAKQVVEWTVPCFALAFAGIVALEVVVEHTVLMMQTGCTIDARKKRPNTHQLLADPTLIQRLG